MYMKKSLSLILAAAMAVTALTGCSSASSDSAAPTAASQADSTAAASGKLTVYGIYKAGDQTWFIDEGAAAKKSG